MSDKTTSPLTAAGDAMSAFYRATDAGDLEAARTALRSIRDAAADCATHDAERKRMTPSLIALTLLVRAETIHLTRGVLRLIDRVEALEQRMSEVQERGIKYCGVYQRALTYHQGDVVTSKGSMWVAVRETTDGPGKSDAWQLAVKSGG